MFDGWIKIETQEDQRTFLDKIFLKKPKIVKTIWNYCVLNGIYYKEKK